MTVAELIRGAFRTLGVLAAEETPSAAEQADALSTLNDLLASWAGERLALYATLRSTHTLTASLSPHTLGIGGDIDVTRPVRIDRASILPIVATQSGLPLPLPVIFPQDSGSELPIRLLSDAEWQNTQGKTSLGMPIGMWVETSYPLMKLHFYPVPNAAYALVLYTWQQLGSFASAAADFDFPPGYARAIRHNLAKEMAPEYGVSLSAEAAFIADESKSTLKRLNERESFLRCDPAVLQGGPFNIVSGGW